MYADDRMTRSSQITTDFCNAATNGTLTTNELSQAIDNVDMGGPGCIPESVGITWIGKHLQEFLKLLLDKKVDLYKFLATHYGNPYLDQLLHDTRLLLALGDDRDRFIRNVFEESVAPNGMWLQAALDAGAEPWYLRELIYNKLRQTPAETRYSNFLTEFVRHGGGLYNRTGLGGLYFTDPMSYWKLLGDDLFDAMCVVAERAPWLLFQATYDYGPTVRDKLRGGLGEQVDKLLCFAASNLSAEHAHLVDFYQLGQLPLENQLYLAQVITPAPMWLIGMAVQSPDPLALVKQYRQAFDINPNALQWHLREWYKVQGDAEYDIIRDTVQQYFEDALRQQGWYIGKLKKQSYRGGMQLVVLAGGKTYVLDRHQTHYESNHLLFPAAGDVVLYQLNGRQLVPNRVYATQFDLAYRPNK